MIIEIIFEKKPPDGEATFLEGINGLSFKVPSVLPRLDGLILKVISVPEPTTVGIGTFGATGFLSEVFALNGMGTGREGDFWPVTSTCLSEEIFTPLLKFPVKVSGESGCVAIFGFGVSILDNMPDNTVSCSG